MQRPKMQQHSAPRGRLSLAIDELKVLEKKATVVAKKITGAMPSKGSTRRSIEAALSYSRPSLPGAAELDVASEELVAALTTLRSAMKRAAAAGVRVQSMAEDLSRATAYQMKLGAEFGSPAGRPIDTSLGGGALQRPHSSAGLVSPHWNSAWTPSHAAAPSPPWRAGREASSQSLSAASSRSQLPPRPATSQGTVRRDKSFASILGAEDSRTLVLGPRPATPTDSYQFRSPAPAGKSYEERPVLTARRFARAGEWALLLEMLHDEEGLSAQAGGSDETLGELYCLRGQALARAGGAGSSATALRNLNMALSKAPWQPLAFYWRGVSQLSVETPSLQAAIRDFEAALQLQDPTQACAWHRLARAQLGLQQYNLAIASSSRAVRILEKEGSQPANEAEIMEGLKSQCLLCRGLATLYAASGKPSAAALVDFESITTEDPGFAGRLLGGSLSAEGVVELWRAFPQDADVSKRYAEGLMDAAEHTAAVTELGRLLALRSESALALRPWALGERLRILAYKLPPPSAAGLRMMASDRAALVESDPPGQALLAAECCVARGYASSSRRADAVAAWNRAASCQGSDYTTVAGLDATAPDYLLGRLAWRDPSTQNRALAHFVGAWSAGYDIGGAPEALSCLAAARLEKTLVAPPEVEQLDLADQDDEEGGEEATGGGVASLAALAAAAAVRGAGGEGGAISADDSLHLALVLATSPAVSHATALSAVPDADKKKWSPEETAAEEQAQLLAQADIASGESSLLACRAHTSERKGLVLTTRLPVSR